MSSKRDYVLGINAYDHDASVCLLRDGEIAYAISKERINRDKHAAGFYKIAVDYCLQAEGIKLDDVGLVVRNSYVLPVDEIELRLLNQHISYYLEAKERAEAEKYPIFRGKPPKVVDISHHVAHAYSAFAACPFDEGAVMIVDGVGGYRSDAMDAGPQDADVHPLARESESYYHFKGSELTPIKKIWMAPTRGFLSDEFFYMPGLGAYYSRGSSYVFADWNKCGELMGLAPYGRPNRIPPLVEMNGQDLRLLDWPAEFDKPFMPDADKDWEKNPAVEHWQDLAWRVQDDAERVLLARARWLRETTGARNLCLAGGVALNCVANGKIAREAGFDNVWIQPAAGDDGIAIGCALYGHLAIEKKPRAFVMKHAFLGREYSAAESDKAMSGLTTRVATRSSVSADVCAEAAKLLAEGKVLGWFQGRSEYGPRALGNRSIIADPRTAEMKDILNRRVKHRQAFRPFAPIVLEERADEIFEGPGDSPYMLMAKPVAAAWRDKIPAIVHVDGTARVQTVREDTNSRLYRLIKEFDALTGVPVLLNTSFNVKGEPIVETPDDALYCFLNTGIDYLVLGDRIVEKGPMHRMLSPVLKFYEEVAGMVRAGLGAAD